MRGGRGDVSERPIIFSAPMVRALLAGRKTMTRRVIKPRPWNKEGDTVNINIAKAARHTRGADGRFYYAFDHPRGGPLTAYVSRIDGGDRLWVRETWQAGMSDGGPCVAYRADNDRWYPEFTGRDEGAGPSFDYDAHPGPKWCHWIADVEARGPWASPIHMPRWASRLTLTVTEVKVERLQDISEADARAEGIEPHIRGGWNWRECAAEDEDQSAFQTAAFAFEDLWDSIHGPGAWLLNPWVAAVRFTVDVSRAARGCG